MSTPLQVLMIEDSPEDAELIIRNLTLAGWSVDSVRVDNVEDLLQCLTRQAWDMILADHYLPAFNCTEALSLVRQEEDEFRKEREFFYITLASIGDGIISTDLAGRIVFMNRVAEELTGWPFIECEAYASKPVDTKKLLEVMPKWNWSARV